MSPANCNKCDRRGCKGNVVRDRFGNISKTIKCPGHVPLRPMRTSLLEKASVHDGWTTVLSEILKATKLRMVQHNGYPRFAFRDVSSQKLVQCY